MLRAGEYDPFTGRRTSARRLPEKTPSRFMSIKDAIDLLFAARERIDFYWNFYVVVVIAVVGWIVTRKEPLTRDEDSGNSGLSHRCSNQPCRALRILHLRGSTAERCVANDCRVPTCRNSPRSGATLVFVSALLGVRCPSGSRRDDPAGGVARTWQFEWECA
jgi:hypothetical protein